MDAIPQTGQIPAVHPAISTRLRNDSMLAIDPSGVVTVVKQSSRSKRKAEASRKWLQRKVDEGLLIRLCDGAFVLADLWENSTNQDALVALAVGLAHPGRAIGGRAAALLQGLPVFEAVTCIDVLTTHGNDHNRLHIRPSPDSYWELRFHRVKTHEGYTQTSQSVRFTTVTTTLFHIARHLPAMEYGLAKRRAGEVVLRNRGRQIGVGAQISEGGQIGAVGQIGVGGENGVRLPELNLSNLDPRVFLQHAECLAMAESAIRGEIREEERLIEEQRLVLERPPICRSSLLELCSTQRRSPGKQKAELLLRHASELSESPFESMAKLLLIVLGLQFVQQARVVDEGGKVVARVDFLLIEFGVVVETDGLSKYDSDARLRSDRSRDFRLTNLGYSVCHLTWKDVTTLKAVEILMRVINAQIQRTETPRGTWFPSHFRLPSSYYKW